MDSTTSAQAAPAAVPEPKPAGKTAGKPFSIIRFFWQIVTFVRLTICFVWNLPGFMTVMQARRLVRDRTKSATLRGYSAALALWPVVPVTLVCAALSYFGADPFALQTLWVVVWTLALIAAFYDIPRKYGIWALICAVCLCIAYGALWWAGVDLNGRIVKAFHKFSPVYHTGNAFLQAIVIAAFCLVDYLLAPRRHAIKVHGNNYLSIELGKPTDHPAMEWRIRERVGDWLEWMWMGTINVALVANWGSGKSPNSEREQDDREEFILQRVPGGRWAMPMIRQAMEVADVEVISVQRNGTSE